MRVERCQTETNNNRNHEWGGVLFPLRSSAFLCGLHILRLLLPPRRRATQSFAENAVRLGTTHERPGLHRALSESKMLAHD
jgi:hypothetical protein